MKTSNILYGMKKTIESEIEDIENKLLVRSVNFAQLSLPLKIFVVLGWMVIAAFIMSFILGFISGFMTP